MQPRLSQLLLANSFVILGLLGQSAADGGASSGADPVTIVAPNVAGVARQTSSAIAEYFKAHENRGAALHAVLDAKTNAPATYGVRLGDLLKAQNKTLESLTKASDFAAQSSQEAVAASTAAETLYGEKADALMVGRTGADFPSEAEAVKLTMR
mmetsp:Transcript_81927/g.228342  ORF Transcript_81927/g.228342 Transcript_81927/m.228342 type:complete len:154 (+) Transcript_81927:74-535(+)